MAKSVLIATPCYGGEMTVGFFRSCMEIASEAAALGREVDFLVTEGESHVTRARNNLVATFETQTDYDTIAFIDADIEISASDFFVLADQPGVRGAAVAMKHPDGESLSCYRDGVQLKRSQMPSEPFSVDYLGSAVLFIDRASLAPLRRLVNRYTDPILGGAYAYFWDGVVDGTWLSEDYGFCLTCKESGTAIICDPSVIVSHRGSSVWRF